MMEQGLIALLTASPAIAGGRVYPRLPQNVVFPAIRYQMIDARRITSIDAQNVGPTEFTLQIDCVGKTYAESKTLANQVRQKLHTYRGSWGTSICRYCYLQSENDLYEQDGDDVTHWVAQRYVITTNDE
jgi:hypothetical protein